MDRVILIPPTHEQSTPSFHIETTLRESFLAFLSENDVPVLRQPVEQLGAVGVHENPIVEVEIEAGTDMHWLESLRKKFLAEPQPPSTRRD